MQSIKKGFLFSFIENNLTLSMIWTLAVLVLAYMSWLSFSSLHMSGFTDVRHYTVQFDTSTVVSKMYISPGSPVRKGQILARLRSYRVELELEKINKELNERLSEYEIEVGRKIVPSQLKIKLNRKSKTSLGFSERQLYSLLKLKDMTLQKINNLNVVSPFDGVIGAINYNREETVPAFSPIFSVHEKHASFVKSYVPEGQQISISPGQEVAINVLGKNLNLKGKVFQVGSIYSVLPARLQRSNTEQSYGREISIQFDGNKNLLVGERVVVTVL